MSLAKHTQALIESLAEAKLVPGSAAEIIPANFRPTTQLGLSFEGKSVDVGNFFRAGVAKQPPTISFAPEANVAPDTTYTLVLTDPDAPTPDDPKFAFWRHWVLSGLQPGKGEAAAVQTEPALTEYLGPGPKDECVMMFFDDANDS